MNHFQKIADQLAAEDLDAVILTSSANGFYASGFPSIEGDGMALVTRNGSFYFTDSRYIEHARAQIAGMTVELVEPSRDYYTWLNMALNLTGSQRVGFEDQAMTVARHVTFAEKLNCRLLPCSDLLSRLRGQKDAQELECLAQAQHIADQALSRLLPEIHPGLREKQIAARLQFLLLELGAEKMSFDPIVASGPNSSVPHAVPTDRKVESGDFITMDFGCKWGGYCSDMTRTVALESVTDEMRRVYETVRTAQEAGVRAAKAGITGRDLDGVARAVIAKAGYGEYFTHSLGHGVGIDIHESPYVMPSNGQPLPEGTVISVEPGIYLPGKFGVRIEDVVFLTKDGCRDLATSDKNLLIL